VVAPETRPDLDLLEPDRPPAYISRMAEETCGVSDRVAPNPHDKVIHEPVILRMMERDHVTEGALLRNIGREHLGG
jgi:hypothetical protein